LDLAYFTANRGLFPEDMHGFPDAITNEGDSPVLGTMEIGVARGEDWKPLKFNQRARKGGASDGEKKKKKPTKAKANASKASSKKRISKDVVSISSESEEEVSKK
jgi:hypothetical protein